MTTTTVNKAELAREMGKAMTDLRNQLRRFIQVKMREHDIDLSFEMLEVLACLWQKNGVNQQEIADITLKDKSSMTYLIDNLTKRNLVKRVEDENDRRNKLIFLTDDAIKLKETLYPWITEMYSKASADINVDDISLSLSIVSQMVTNLNNLK